MSKKQKEKYKFCFPDPMAKMMKKVDMRTQMESSLFSMFLVLISMSLMAVYLILFAEGTLVYKIIVVANLLCGFLFIFSFLITTYHQYISYMEILGIDPEEHKREIKKRGNILKRIYLAIKENKAKKKLEKEKTEQNKILTPTLLEEAKNNLEIITNETTTKLNEIEKSLSLDNLNKKKEVKKNE